VWEEGVVLPVTTVAESKPEIVTKRLNPNHKIIAL
jgi:hypothetical protein